MYQLQNRSPPTAPPRATSPSRSHARSNVDSCHQDMTAERRVSGADMSYIFREYSGRLKLYYWETAQNQKGDQSIFGSFKLERT
ncbi:unnamed protein product [Anisakis simplex]|uniref:Uncharacterized protein n=1 Tax=Anisakis simplex TaxID=6269 RepID=A0A0M3JJQ7_ANISI|nr:unnamed protein product [Anisakis simplex]